MLVLFAVVVVYVFLKNTELFAGAGPMPGQSLVVDRIVDVRKYHNQPLKVLKNDWSGAEYTKDNLRVSVENEAVTITASTREEKGQAYLVQAEIVREVVCSSASAAEENLKTLEQFGLEDFYYERPNKQTTHSRLYCDETAWQMVGVSCTVGTPIYTVSVSDYDRSLCQPS